MRRMKRTLAIGFVMVLVVAGCGGDDGSGDVDGAENNNAGTSGPEPSDDNPSSEDTGGGSSEEPTPEASGPLSPDSIRIGSEVWSRTLPMTSGQCFVFKDDGTLPDSAVAWGSLDNDDSLSFSANYGQDGTFEAEVRGETMYWVAGERSGTELTVELDFDNLTITGEGIFNNLHTNEFAHGSFNFICEDDGTGT